MKNAPLIASVIQRLILRIDLLDGDFVLGRCVADSVPAVPARRDRIGAEFVVPLWVGDLETALEMERELVRYAKATWPERNLNDHIGGGKVGTRRGQFAVFVAFYPSTSTLAA